jgi:hypothetical protein
MPLLGHRHSYADIFGPGLLADHVKATEEYRKGKYVVTMPNEWYGPARSGVAVADGRMFWVAGSQLVCIGPWQREDGPPRPAPRMEWNHPRRFRGGPMTSSYGHYDPTIEKETIPFEKIEMYLADPPTVRQSNDPAAMALRTKLDQAVREILDGPWAIWTMQLGGAGHRNYFWRSAETLRILSCALPHLSGQTRQDLLARLDAMVDAGVPLSKPVWANEGKRRELYDLPDDLANDPLEPLQRYRADVEDVYAIWAYAYHADRFQKLKDQSDAIREAVNRSFRSPVRFDHEKDHDASVHLNGHITGLIGYWRLMNYWQNEKETDFAERALAELVSDRIHHERADDRLQSSRAQFAYIPRYRRMCPALGKMLRDLAPAEIGRNIRDCNQQLPVWYQAWGERLIGGQNYTNPPTLARALFAANAWCQNASPKMLTTFLDQPWCKADLYYVEKLSMVLQKYDRNTSAETEETTANP